MKKFSMFLVCVIALLSLTGCSMLYDNYQNNAINGFDVKYSEVLDEAFVDTYHWDGTDEAKNIVIPEEYNDMKITALGGYYGRGVPCAFGIELPESYTETLCDEANRWTSSRNYEDVGSVDTVYLNFNIHLSKNVEEITRHSLDTFREGEYFDGEKYHTKIIIVLLYKFTCDEDNETFYAKDGKLYYREDDSVVSDILYFDHDFEK
ncbi:MAG: hypothetical protein J6A55_04970 [Oscillospiraceae bacterium]|nr:hypothetical protein [Oscillospiraceae bacterium]